MSLSPRELRVALLIALAAGLLVRLAVVGTLGFPTDVEFFQAQAERLRQVGPADFYTPGFFSDYPPAYLSLLGAIAWLLGGMPAAVFKASSIPFDLAIAVTLYLVLRRIGEERAGVVAASLYILNPALVFAGPYWGQTDAAGTLPFLLALVALGFGRFGLAGAFAGLAVMAKLQSGLAAVPVAAIALFVLLRERRSGPLVRAAVGGGIAFLAFALPFRLDLFGLLGRAAATYPYTSLFVFNTWGILGDFWQPDDRRLFGVAMQQWGALLFGLALLATLILMWRDAPSGRRFGSEPAHDLGLALASGALLVFAFFFLPTRVHERYLFPAFAMLASFAAMRRRALVAYVVLSAFFLLNLDYAFTRYPQTETRAPDFLEATVYQRPGVILLAILGLVVAARVAWWWWRRREYTLEAEPEQPVASVPATLPAALRVGRRPTRRDLTAALLLALVVVLTRTWRLDWPRDMYFDEVYHARTAMELLAGREPYEWTHPHLAKELMAASIVLFGDVRAVGREDVPPDVVAYAASGDGWRAWALPDGSVRFDDGSGGKPRDLTKVDGEIAALAIEGRRVVVATARQLAEIPVDHAAVPRSITLPAPPRALAVTKDEIAVATEQSVLVFRGLERPAFTAPVGDAVALQFAPAKGALYVASADGTVRQVRVTDSEGHAAGETERTFQTNMSVTGMTVVPEASRILLADASEPLLASIDLDSGAVERVRVDNDRTAPFRGPIAALAASTRSRLVFALGPDGVAVIEPHGVSAFAVVREAAGARALAIDDMRDRVVAAGGTAPVEISAGRVAFAWRLPGVLAGGVLAFFLFLLARRLFASRVVAALLAAFVVLDGSMFAQSRIGMNDIYVATAIVAGWYFVVAALQRPPRPWLDLLLAGIALGLGLASKWTAGPALLAVGLASLVVTARAFVDGRAGAGGPLDLLAGRGRNAVFLALSFVAVPIAIYLVSYLPWFGLGHELFASPDGRWSFVELQRQMYTYHANLTAPHPAGSPWWAWPLDLKPVYWEYEPAAPEPNLVLDGLNAIAAALARVAPDSSRGTYIYDAGNLVSWWAGIPAMAFLLWTAWRTRAWHLAVLALAFLTQYAEWIPVSRVLFQYHFFTALPFYLIGLAASLGVLWERPDRRAWVYGVVAGSALWFVWFYPWLSALPVPGTLSSFYYWWPTWQYGCQFYPSFRCG